MSKMIVPLSPCKHCGGEAKAQKFTGEIGVVSCTQCGIQTPYLKTDEAIRRWNTSPKGRKPHDIS